MIGCRKKKFSNDFEFSKKITNMMKKIIDIINIFRSIALSLLGLISIGWISIILIITMFAKPGDTWLTNFVADVLIMNEQLSSILGTFKPDKYNNHIPIGNNLWNITDPNCKGIRHLKLTGVSTL